MKTYRVPPPVVITCPTPYGVAYGWQCHHKTLGIQVIENSQRKAMDSFKEAVESEYPGQYTPIS